MNRIKKFLLLAMALTVLLCCGVTAYADSGAPDPESVQVADTVVFTNTKDTSPGLSVGKQVATEVDVDYSQDEFEFKLYLNGQPAMNQNYRFFQKGGAEIVRYLDGNNTVQTAARAAFEAKVANGEKVQEIYFQTDPVSGGFTLKDGEVAKFVDLDEDTPFELVEIDMSHKWEKLGYYYEQSYPEKNEANPNGSHSGEIKKSDTTVYMFRNTLVPPPPPPGGGGKTYNLTVQKNLEQDGSYSLPETDTVFRFRVCKVEEAQQPAEGEPEAGQTPGETLVLLNTGYKVYATDKNSSFIKEVAAMEEPGIITLHAGEKAEIIGLPQYAVYRVEEIIPEEFPGWWLDGQQSEDVTMTAHTTIPFNNRMTSFGVRKAMKDNSLPEEDFVFLLKRADNTVWENAEYYLYSSSTSQRIDDTLHKTNMEGAFTLRAGQTAVFIGIAPRTGFSVEEQDKPGYKLAQGVTGLQTVEETVKVLDFVNEVEEIPASLSVKKTVTTETESVDSETQFWFRISNATKGPATPIDVSYTVNGVLAPASTGEKGLFALKSGDVADFTGIAPDEKYRVEELGVRIENEDGSITYSLEGYQTLPGKVQERVLNEDSPKDPLAFENRYKSSGSLKLLKVDKEDNTRVLKGAEFTLTKLDAALAVDTRFPVKTLVTGDDGIYLLQDELVSGIYRLEETKAPDGYLAMKEPVLLEISLKNKEVTITNPNADRVEGTVTVSKDGLEKTVVEITVQNGFYRLPKTGGIGTECITLGGIMLLLCAAYLYGLRKKLLNNESY